MSLTIALISLLVFAWRLRNGAAGKAEKTLWVVWFLHFLIVSMITYTVREDNGIDSRYLKPVDCLVWGAAIWALLKIRFGKYIIYGILAVLVVYNGVMLTKHLKPGSRRNANVLACKWAEDVIRADWKGPADKGADRIFTIHEYTSGGSPSISPISKRMNYVLGARNANTVFGRRFAPPKYIVEEAKRLRFNPWKASDYVLLAEKQIGKRHYLLYKKK